MTLHLQVVPPVKNAEFKITLTTNRDAVQLVSIFGDMLVQVGGRNTTPGNAA